MDQPPGQHPQPAGTAGAAGVPADGLGVLHLFARVGPGYDPGASQQALKQAEAAGVQVVTVAVLGHKADVGLVALSSDPWQLRDLQTALQSAGLQLSGSYLSLTEVSEYAAGIPDEMKLHRLRPQLPPADKPAFCFYPMSKRREATHNWYELDFDTRKELMYGHGLVGRSFRGRVLQLITGSAGLDDWEWGVTLFGRRLDDLKDCVYQMRFDAASARYAEFGPFWTGMVGAPEDVLGRVGRR